MNAQGRPLNLGFETGTLADWTAQGDAFKGQPIRGDSIHMRRGDMKSGHQGQFWVGTYEMGGDELKGRLTSVPFRVSKPYASFLVGGGSHAATYVELVTSDTRQVLFRVSGEDREDMERVVAELSAHQGKEIVIRIVDEEGGGWGHINFDDFRLHDAKPAVPERRRPAAQDVYAHNGLGPSKRPAPWPFRRGSACPFSPASPTWSSRSRWPSTTGAASGSPRPIPTPGASPTSRPGTAS